MRRSGDVVSKQQLLEEVWGPTFAGDPNIVEVYVGYLRKKVDAPFATHTILTVRGAGYRTVAGCVTPSGGPSGPCGSVSPIAAALVFGIAFGLASARAGPHRREPPRRPRRRTTASSRSRPRSRRSRPARISSNVIVATRTPVFTWVIGPSGRVLYGSAFVPPGFDVATSTSRSGRGDGDTRRRRRAVHAARRRRRTDRSPSRSRARSRARSDRRTSSATACGC